MVRGPRKHLKRLNAPKSWMLDKLGGTFAPRPRCGPHKLVESLPLCLIVRRKLSFAQNSKEVEYIIRNRVIKVDGKVRTDPKYPAGIMDVVSIPKIHENYRILYNTNKKFCLQPITEEEAKFKLCKVVAKNMGLKGIMTIHTNDGRTIKYVTPDIQVGDTIKYNLEKQEMEGFFPFEVGRTGFALRGKNIGCVGIIKEIKKHVGGFEMVTLQDQDGRTFLTRASNIIAIGSNGESMITLPKEKGVRISLMAQSNLVYGEFVDNAEEEKEQDQFYLDESNEE
ncbi:small subunit ribosomal protein S4e [Nematocida sp. AWRm80]|nr:small subunit ribosomal protein S4e [Nematocida sp. AWRm80]